MSSPRFPLILALIVLGAIAFWVCNTQQAVPQ